MGKEEAYILTTEPEEIERLRFQHHAWIEQAYALFARAGLSAGDVVLDLGWAGLPPPSSQPSEGGRVIARDESERFLEDSPRSGPPRPPLDRAELGRVGTCAPSESLDAAYARWLFCWLRELEVVLASVARGGPGGAVMLQGTDWGRMAPPAEPDLRARRRSLRELATRRRDDRFRHARADAAAACSLEVSTRPARGSAPPGRSNGGGSAASSRATSQGERGAFSAADLRSLEGRAGSGGARGRGYCYAPTMVDGVLRKPR
jgi:hypothetical protein